jgi:hypothetical protein
MISARGLVALLTKDMERTTSDHFREISLDGVGRVMIG